MTYSEAFEKAFNVKWKLQDCPSSGQDCWCSMVVPEEPILFKESEDIEYDSEYIVINSGSVDKKTASYIVELHNKFIDSLTGSDAVY